MIPNPSDVAYLSLPAFRQMQENAAPVLLDVRTPEAFEEGHLPGARNFCVYEVAFLDKVRDSLDPDSGKTLVAYGESSGFKAAEVAFARLMEAGYPDVRVLSGGLCSWLGEGGRVHTGKAPPPAPSGKLTLDPGNSHLRWFGRNPTSQHEGAIGLKSGYLEVNEDRAPVAGEVVVDMESLTCTDLTDPELNAGLIRHLKHADFFKVENYPEAAFRLERALPLPEAPPGQPNWEVTGNMTLRGVTRSLDFPAMLQPLADGYSFQAQPSVNRVLFGAVYGSGSVFERLGMHLVNDFVHLHITARFKKA